MTGVQLIGIQPVIARFEKSECESWALYQGKQFIVGGVGADVLRDWLNDFEQSGSTATYILRAYDSQEAPTSSTGNTDYVLCVQFKVTDQYEGYGIAGHSNKLMQRIDGIEKQLKEALKPEPDDDDQGGTIGAVITDWLTNPQKLAVVFGIAKEIFNGSATGQPVYNSLPTATVPMQPQQTISGFGMGTVEKVQNNSEEGLQRISRALDILGEKDDNLVVHLEKLADLATKEPVIFKSVITKLDLL